MLTLFMMVGVSYVVVASRARQAAKSYARAMLWLDESRRPHAALLDTTLMKVLRAPPTAFSPPRESLLADMYGVDDSLEGTLTGVSSPVVGGAPGFVVTGTMTLSSGAARPAALLGRVLTTAGPEGPVNSYRIVKCDAASLTNSAASTFTVALSLPCDGRLSSELPNDPCSVVINGREYSGTPATSGTTRSNEGWDGFDSHNDFIAYVAADPANVSRTIVARGSFLATGTSPNFAFPLPSGTGSGTYTLLASGTGSGITLVDSTLDYDTDQIPDAADNDNDGVIDGVFLDWGLPDITDLNGNTVKCDASVLVVDLDSRFNVNAHDSLSRLLYGGSSSLSGSASSNWGGAGLTTAAPLGSGYGPPEIDGSKLFPTFTGTAENPVAFTIVGGASAFLTGTYSATSRYASGTATPRLTSLAGRLGESPPTNWIASGTSQISVTAGFPRPRPGAANIDDFPSRLNDRRSLSGTAVSGIPSLWWTGSSSFAWSGTSTRGTFNSPPDLHGYMKTLTSATAPLGGPASTVPKLIFAKPEWGDIETTDDPFEISLDTRRGVGGYQNRPAGLGQLQDNPFTPADLEAVLRPYDADTKKLPQRLAAMLGSLGENARTYVTTDSWDTTAITGTAASLLFGTTATGAGGWLGTHATSATLSGTSPVTGLLGGEVARGERFDLNRHLTPIKPPAYNIASPYYAQRQAYFKDLYTLAVMLKQGSGGPLSTNEQQELAQWAANVVEFRDADSTMTPFEYDIDLTNGWDVDGDVTTTDGGHPDRAVVWGTERPEVLISEMLAWKNMTPTPTGGLVISLHRPWNALAIATGTISIPAEACDEDLRPATPLSADTNSIDLGRTIASPYPTWRLRVVSGASTAYVRFDTDTTTNTAGSVEYGLSGVANPAFTPKLPVDHTLCLYGAPSPTFRNGTTSATFAISGTSSSFSTQAVTTDSTTTEFRIPDLAANEATIFLERLSDPAATISPTVWAGDQTTLSSTHAAMYRIVDSGTVTVLDTQTPIPTPLPYLVRTTGTSPDSFWRNAFQPRSPPSAAVGTPLSSGSTAWFPFNNRPFISATELVHVPVGDSLQMLSGYSKVSPLITSGTNSVVPFAALFDAVHVPSRFAGLARTTADNYSLFTNIYPITTAVNQLSGYREPGRVNLNTITLASNTSSVPLTSGSSPVWNAVVAGRLNAPAVSSGSASLANTPAQSLFELLTMSGTTNAVVADTNTAFGAELNLNPTHEFFTATRLANTTTVRSNLFAVWITLRLSIPDDPDSVRLHRGFYIVDRSIPVGFDGENELNARDTIRLRRIIQ